MEYRELGRTGLHVSAISLGTEHLLGVPREQIFKTLALALDSGVNYFDLFPSQQVFRDTVSAALQGRRQELHIAAHLGAVLRGDQYSKTRDPAVARQFYDDFLMRLRTDHADVLFLHSSDGQEDYDRIFGEDGLFECALSLKAQGKARFIGFSGHTVVTAMQAVARVDIDVLMFPINLASHAVPGKEELLRVCARAGVGVVGMKPFAGGRLLSQGPSISLEHWHSGGSEYSLARTHTILPAQCIRYCLSQPGVSAIVPGCKSPAELAGTLAYFNANEQEKDFASLLGAFGQYRTGECVYCNHCLPCPAEIDIAAVMRLADATSRGEELDWRRLREPFGLLKGTPTDCTECGACVKRCPFGVDVIGQMRLLRQRMSAP